MNMSVMQAFVGIAMAGIAVLIVYGFRAYLANSSERRMRSMLESVGLDPAIAHSNEIPTIMREVRQRCRTCRSEGVCERWLDGKEKGGNDFCPNAKVFEVLQKHSRAA
jgi:hypothetical protein